MVADALKQRFTAAQIGKVFIVPILIIIILLRSLICMPGQHYRRVLQPKLEGCQQGVWAPDEEVRSAQHCDSIH